MILRGAPLTLGLVLGAFAMLSAGDTVDARQQTPAERPVVRISAERFSFTPSRIKLTIGDEVELRLTSQDTAHGFRLVREGADETEEAIDVVLPKRGTGDASVIFKADRVGRWTFECSRMCGAGHNFMRGEIVVEPRSGGTR